MYTRHWFIVLGLILVLSIGGCGESNPNQPSNSEQATPSVNHSTPLELKLDVPNSEQTIPQNIDTNTSTESAVSATPITPEVPLFKARDWVYLAISSEIEITTIKSNDGDYLIPYDAQVKLNFKGSKGERFLPISAKDLLDKIAESIKNNPEGVDRGRIKANWSEGKGSADIKFAGIRRLYELKAIEIPSASAYRQSRDKAPILCISIFENGNKMPPSDLIASDTWYGARAWEWDFPSDKSNVWEVREGIGNTYRIRLTNSVLFLRDESILDRTGITAEDFRMNNGIITEKPSGHQVPESLIKFSFASINQ